MKNGSWHDLNELNWQNQVQEILDYVNKLNKPLTMGVLYNQILENLKVKYSYKTFQRMIVELAERELITAKIINMEYGRSRIVSKNK